MTDTAYVLYVGVLAFITQLVMIALQLRTYLRTNHSSLLLLAIASACAVLYLAFAYVPLALPPAVAAAAMTRWLVHLISAGLLTLQFVFGVWGAVSLFRAFEKLHLDVPPDK